MELTYKDRFNQIYRIKRKLYEWYKEVFQLM